MAWLFYVKSQDKTQYRWVVLFAISQQIQDKYIVWKILSNLEIFTSNLLVEGGGTGGWNKNYLVGKNWKLNLTYQFLPDLATLIWVCSNLIFRILNTVCKSMCIHSFTFNSQFLYELKHKVCLFKSMCGFFHFLFCFAFIKVYILFNKKHGLLDLKMS